MRSGDVRSAEEEVWMNGARADMAERLPGDLGGLVDSIYLAIVIVMCAVYGDTVVECKSVPVQRRVTGATCRNKIQ